MTTAATTTSGRFGFRAISLLTAIAFIAEVVKKL
jgi:hypothetical protein